jgi:hypothetical protein
MTSQTFKKILKISFSVIRKIAWFAFCLFRFLLNGAVETAEAQYKPTLHDHFVGKRIPGSDKYYIPDRTSAELQGKTFHHQ